MYLHVITILIVYKIKQLIFSLIDHQSQAMEMIIEVQPRGSTL